MPDEKLPKPTPDPKPDDGADGTDTWPERGIPLAPQEFSHARAAFAAGDDDPRAYLERCLAAIELHEPRVQAFTALNADAAREAADASSRRWQDGNPLSPIDGMPVGIKDLLETKDMPTEMGCAGLKGNFPKRDNPAVWALRQAGAIILGKTVTAELGGTHPGPTRNPLDETRTPGGSSSGSAAAVAAGMVPAAIGTQVGGSIIRPASYCGNVAIKPSQGAVNRGGERQTTSQSTHGVHANSLADMWRVLSEIHARVGGDRGTAGLTGPAELPDTERPSRLVVLQTAGWDTVDPDTRQAFDTVLSHLKDADVAAIGREDAKEVDALERAIADADPISNAITRWENRWIYRSIADQGPGALSPRLLETLEQAEAMTPADYHDALERRAQAQACHAETAPFGDAIVLLSAPGPAPMFTADTPGAPLAPKPTGDAVFNYPSSMLFVPAVTVPLATVQGLPVGIQVMGQPGDDAKVTAIARWMLETLPPVICG